MAGSSFGTLFCMTTWGETHGKGVGVVVDGCPAGLSLCEEDIQKYLNRRSRDSQSTQQSEKKMIRWRFYREFLRERQQELQFLWRYLIKTSIQKITLQSRIFTVRAMQIIHLIRSMVSVIIAAADVPPAGKPLAGLLPVPLPQRF